MRETHDNVGTPYGGLSARAVREVLDHKAPKTTMIYTHVLNRCGVG